MLVKDWELLRISPGDGRFPRMSDYVPYLLEPLGSDTPRSYFHFTLLRRSSIAWIRGIVVMGG